MLNLLESCVDESVALLLVLMVFVVMGVSGLIVTMQVQQETVYLVGLSSDFMNETIVKHPELMQWLPEGAQVQETVRTAMDSVYMYARDWVVGSVSFLNTLFSTIFLIFKKISDFFYKFFSAEMVILKFMNV